MWESLAATYNYHGWGWPRFVHDSMESWCNFLPLVPVDCFGFPPTGSAGSVYNPCATGEVPYRTGVEYMLEVFSMVFHSS